MQVENVLEVGEGAHFIHIFVQPGPSTPGLPTLLEVNLNSADVESVTVFDIEAATSNVPVLLDANGNPIGDEVQMAERHPVTVEDAGSTPVVPANENPA